MAATCRRPSAARISSTRCISTATGWRLSASRSLSTAGISTTGISTAGILPASTQLRSSSGGKKGERWYGRITTRMFGRSMLLLCSGLFVLVFLRKLSDVRAE